MTTEIRQLHPNPNDKILNGAVVVLELLLTTTRLIRIQSDDMRKEFLVSIRFSVTSFFKPFNVFTGTSVDI